MLRLGEKCLGKLRDEQEKGIRGGVNVRAYFDEYVGNERPKWTCGR